MLFKFFLVYIFSEEGSDASPSIWHAHFQILHLTTNWKEGDNLTLFIVKGKIAATSGSDVFFGLI